MRKRWIPVVVAILGLTSGGCRNAAPPESRVLRNLPDGTSLSDIEIERYLDLRGEARAAWEKGNSALCAQRFAEVFVIWAGNDADRYLAARCLTLSGDTEGALASLEAAIQGGFQRLDLLEKDEDLDALRGEGAFIELVAEAHRTRNRLVTRDPLEDLGPGAGPFASLEALNDHFEESVGSREEALGRARKLLGLSARRQLAHADRRNRIAALRRYGKEHPGDAAEAEFLALTTFAYFEPTPPGVEEAADRFLDTYGSTPQAAAAIILRAEAKAGAELVADRSLEGHAEAVAQVAATALTVIEEMEASPYARDAWQWLLRDATLRRERDAMREYLSVLRERWGHNGSIEARMIAYGLPEFAVESIEGEPLDLQSLKGQVTLIDFWATWCGPCVSQFPRLKEIYATYHSRGFEIVGVSADDDDHLNRDAFRQWLADEDIPWPQFYDGKGRDNELVRLFEVQSFPTKILLDREGKVVGVNLGIDALETKLHELL